MSYSYDLSALKVDGVAKMRFELGDTMFNPAELTAALTDEEYQAVIDTAGNWRTAKIKCLKAILMKYSHQTKTTVGPLTYDFSSRVDVWRKLLDDLKAEGAAAAVPAAIDNVYGMGGEAYFHKDMQKNHRHDGGCETCTEMDWGV